jgi:hypothetical protein
MTPSPSSAAAEVRCKHPHFVNFFDQSGNEPMIEGVMCMVCLKSFFEDVPPPADSILITREQLKGIEFDFDGRCSNCFGSEEGGHKPDCWIFLALGEKR